MRLGMTRVAVVVCLSCGLSLADQVTLKNGDTITGSIIKKDGEKLTIKSEFLGEVTMPWDAVTSVKSDAPVHVALPNGTELTGKLTTGDGKLEVSSTPTPQRVPLPEVEALRDEAEQRKYERLLAPGLLELWSGYFDTGVSVARGNARTGTLSTAFNAARPTRNDKITLHFDQIYSSATINGRSGTTARAIHGSLTYDHDIGSRVFVSAFNNYEYDRFQDLDLRLVAGGGLGFHAINTERTKFDLTAGGNYTRENFGNSPRRNSGEGYWGDDLFYKVTGVTTVTQSYRMFNNLTQTGEYRVNADLGIATTLRKWLSWQITANDRFLSNQPPGRVRNDLQLTTGFRASFAR